MHVNKANAITRLLVKVSLNPDTRHSGSFLFQLHKTKPHQHNQISEDEASTASEQTLGEMLLRPKSETLRLSFQAGFSLTGERKTQFLPPTLPGKQRALRGLSFLTQLRSHSCKI